MNRRVLPRHPDQPRFIDRIEQVDHVRIVRLRGTIDYTTAEAGYEFILALHEENEPIDYHLLIDCTRLVDVDSSAIALLVVRMRDYLAAGREVALLNADPKVRTYVSLAKLEPRIRMFTSEEEAVTALSVEANPVLPKKKKK